MLYKTFIFGGGIFEKKFKANTKNCRIVNDKTLFKILKLNEKTEIGIKLNFKGIKSVKEFKNQVPLTEYKYYEDYINRMADGERNILVCGDIEYFGHTSGTTGKQKLIPCTKRSRRISSKYMAVLTNKFSYDNFKERWNYGKGLMIADIAITTYTKGGLPICSATSGGMKGIKHILPYLYTSPIEIMKIKDKESALYLHLLFGLMEDKLLYISAVFISNILDLFRVLEDKHQSLSRDIRRGSLSNKLNIDDDTRNVLNKLIASDTKRADKLELEFQKGFKGIARRIWPSLSYIATVTGASFSIYDEKVKYYTDSLPIYSPAYAATEAMVGINTRADKIRYVIIPDTAFYEFIDVDGQNDINNDIQNNNALSKKSIETYCIDELKIGKKYEIVVTNYAGLYRYRIGDVIRVVDFYNNCPKIEFLYRKNQVLNMVAEKTNEDHLTNSIKNAMRKLSLDLVEYTTLPDNSVTPGRYIFYFEFKNNMTRAKLQMLESVLDEEIRNSNLAYDRARNNKRLGMVKVINLLPNTFNLIKENLFDKGVSKNQIKIPRVILDNKNYLDIISKNIINS